MAENNAVAHRIEWTIIPGDHPHFDHKFGGLIVAVYDQNDALLAEPYILSDDMKQVGDKEWDVPLPAPIAPDDYNGRLSRWSETVAAIAEKFNLKNWYPHVERKEFYETLLQAYALSESEPAPRF